MRSSPTGAEQGPRTVAPPGPDVVRALREAILTGELPAGTVLSQSHLSSLFAVSRSPVRRALRLLREEGLVESAPRRRLVVREISPERCREVILVRRGLEAIVFQAACRVMTPSDVDSLGELIEGQKRLAALDEPAKFAAADAQFHRELASRTGLSLISGMLAELRAPVRLMALKAFRHPPRMGEVIEEHTAIVDAIAARDRLGALAVLGEHLTGLETVLSR